MIYDFGKRANPCGDCDNGHCTMNCGPALAQVNKEYADEIDEQAATIRSLTDAVEKLTEAVGRVLTWAHRVEGVVVVREDHFDGLSPANAAVIAATQSATPNPTPEG